MEPSWLSVQIVLAIHSQTVAAFGGSDGVRDMGLLESALDRARNLFAYAADPSPFELAAAYCSGIVRNHPFIDGNKRTGLLAANAFLDLNGYSFRPDEADAVNFIVALAAGEIDETAIAQWFAEYTKLKSG